MRLVLCLFAIFPFVNENGVGNKSNQQKELEALKGTWEMISQIMGKEKVPIEQCEGIVIIFTSKTYKMEKDGFRLARASGKYNIDPTKNPKHIDLSKFGDSKKPYPAIYKIVGDKLTICGEFFRNIDLAKRPNSFNGDDPLLMVFRKRK